MPSFSISVWLPSLTSWATRSRSRMISSTVSPPMIERRCPAKIRPHNSSMRSCSAKKRRAALAIEAVSSPTLKNATAWRRSGMPCLVTQSSTSSDSRSASDSTRAFCLIGMTNAPCPVTIRNCVAPSLCLEPEISSASSGAGTCQNSTGLSFLRQRGDGHRARVAALDDDDASVLGDRLVGVGGKALGAAADVQHHLAGPTRWDGHAHVTDRADQLGLGTGLGHAAHRTERTGLLSKICAADDRARRTYEPTILDRGASGPTKQDRSA